jgi:hypothetical protein
MKFTSIRLKGLNTIDLPVSNISAKDPYLLKSAEGLGPPEVNVFISQTVNMDGYYKGRQAQYREIVLNISLNQDYQSDITISDLRAALYGLLSPLSNDSMDIIIIDDTVELMRTQGYIKKLEIMPFAAEPEVQLTISCLKAYFESPNTVFVETVPGTYQEVLNLGTAETGLILAFEFDTECTEFVIFDSRGNTMTINHDFFPNDILVIDTNPGNRSITLGRDETASSIIYALSMDSEWLWLYGGLNIITTTNSDFTWEELSYIPRYWGI